jgi:hypothetical protein
MLRLLFLLLLLSFCFSFSCLISLTSLLPSLFSFSLSSAHRLILLVRSWRLSSENPSLGNGCYSSARQYLQRRVSRTHSLLKITSIRQLQQKLDAFFAIFHSSMVLAVISGKSVVAEEMNHYIFHIT